MKLRFDSLELEAKPNGDVGDMAVIVEAALAELKTAKRMLKAEGSLG